MFQTGNSYLFKLLVSLLLLIPFVKKAQSQSPGEKRPKLVVRVVVEQMRYEMLLRYWERFEENEGFKKLVNKGVLCKNTKLNYALTERAPGIATLTTGSSPSSHGIIADYWYNRLSGEKEFCVDGGDFNTVGGDQTKEGFGPTKLLAGTLGDELKMLNPQSKVFSVSLNPVSAVMGAGYNSDGAFWYNDQTGKWVTSSYYTDTLPSWTKRFHKKGLQKTYMKRQWETLMPDSTYKYSLPDEYEAEEGFLLIYKNNFPYNLSLLKNKSGTYKYLKYTPFGNTYTKDFAHTLILNESLGKDNHTDLLTISFAASSYVNDIFGPRSVEMEDLYLRLDRQLDHLLSFLEETVGKDEFLLVLTSDRGCADSYEYRNSMNMPARNFKPKQGLSLLSSYLDIVFDNEDWVKNYTKRQLYLDHGLIDQHGHGLSKFQETVANFLVKKSGISYAVKGSTLQEGDFSEGINYKLQNSYHPKRSGDLFIGLEAGSHEQPVSSGSSYNYHAHIPLIWYGKGINRSTVTREINLRDVAPTISMLINIPLPEASTGKPIWELLSEEETLNKD